MLWDLAPTKRVLAWFRALDADRTAPPAERESSASKAPRRTTRAAPTPAVERYEALIRDMLATHSIRVRRWRTSMSGVAWQVRCRDGSIDRLIEAPRPKGPMSAAVFLHEVGHHAIGFNVHRLRCLEEYYAWAWALARMQENGITITDSVRYRMHQSLAYAVAKARRRGLRRRLPAELEPFAVPLPRRRVHANSPLARPAERRNPYHPT